jgi:hypothetical protein
LKTVTCSVCPAGSYADVTGLVTCKLCDKSKFQGDVGASTCVACSSSQFTTQTGQTSCSVCPASTYHTSGTTCNSCPAFGAVCANGLITATDGYYVSQDALSGAVSIIACPSGYCPGGQCGPNRLNASGNPLCGSCADGFFPSGTPYFAFCLFDFV